MRRDQFSGISARAIRVSRSIVGILTHSGLVVPVAIALLLGPSGSVHGAEEAAVGANIIGVVTNSAGTAVTDAQVTIVGLRRTVRTDDKGQYRFDRLSDGEYILQAVSRRFGSAVVKVTIAGPTDVQADLRLDLAVHQETIVVTATAEPRSLTDVAAPVAVLSGTDLEAVARPSLGDTLEAEPGIASTHFGAGASRPVIRGLGGDRVRVLESGVGVGDASNVSPDHNVSNDPGAADQIEVVRGPATLLYGSSAVGGVVNILDGRIPDRPLDHPIGGSVDLAASTNDDERKGMAELEGGVRSFAWHASYLKRETDDYSSGEGRIDNSKTDSEQWSGGGSWVTPSGYLGLSYTEYDAFYGVPGDEPISIDMQQRRWDLASEHRSPEAAIRTLKVRVGHTDYTHSEIDNPTGEIGTTFNNLSTEGRVEMLHAPLGPFTGVLGAQLSTRDFEAIGEEAIVPRTNTDTGAVFFLEEWGPKKLRFSLGARYESQDVQVDDPVLPDRRFDAISASVSLLWKLGEAWAIVPSISRAERPPVAEELYTFGNHPATGQFEIGDPDLGKETSTGVDLSLRKTSGRISGELNLYANRFADYISLLPIGCCDAESGFPFFNFEQQDADFYGGELHADVEILHHDPHHLSLEVLADAVRAELRDTNDSLPYIPPSRAGIGLHYQGASFWARADARHVFDQDRVTDYGFGTTAETPTPGYTLYNLLIGYRLVAGTTVHDFMLAGTNLSDRLALNHVSPLKEDAPLPGRNVRLSYRLIF